MPHGKHFNGGDSIDRTIFCTVSYKKKLCLRPPPQFFSTGKGCIINIPDTSVHFYRATAKHGIAIDILSVRLSNACIVTKRDNSRLQTYEYVRYSNVSSLLRLNFVVLSLRVHPERSCQRGLPLCRKRKCDQ